LMSPTLRRTSLQRSSAFTYKETDEISNTRKEKNRTIFLFMKASFQLLDNSEGMAVSVTRNHSVPPLLPTIDFRLCRPKIEVMADNWGRTEASQNIATDN